MNQPISQQQPPSVAKPRPAQKQKSAVRVGLTTSINDFSNFHVDYFFLDNLSSQAGIGLLKLQWNEYDALEEKFRWWTCLQVSYNCKIIIKKWKNFFKGSASTL